MTAPTQVQQDVLTYVNSCDDKPFMRSLSMAVQQRMACLYIGTGTGTGTPKPKTTQGGEPTTAVRGTLLNESPKAYLVAIIEPVVAERWLAKSQVASTSPSPAGMDELNIFQVKDWLWNKIIAELDKAGDEWSLPASTEPTAPAPRNFDDFEDDIPF